MTICQCYRFFSPDCFVRYLFLNYLSGFFFFSSFLNKLAFKFLVQFSCSSLLEWMMTQCWYCDCLCVVMVVAHCSLSEIKKKYFKVCLRNYNEIVLNFILLVYLVKLRFLSTTLFQYPLTPGESSLFQNKRKNNSFQQEQELFREENGLSLGLTSTSMSRIFKTNKTENTFALMWLNTGKK